MTLLIIICDWPPYKQILNNFYEILTITVDTEDIGTILLPRRMKRLNVATSLSSVIERFTSIVLSTVLWIIRC